MARTPPARAVGQRPLIAAVAVVVLAVAGTSLMSLKAQQGGSTRAVGGQQGGPAEPEPGRVAEVVGPVRGADVPAYVDDRTAALLEAPAAVDTAVVSFTQVLRVQDALALVEGTGTVRAVLLRLPLQLAAPTTVRVGPGEDPVAAVDAELEAAVAPLAQEQDELRQLLDGGTVDDEDFIEEYERRLAEITEVRELVEDGGALVHAVVVRAPVEELQALEGTTAVRLVDPAPPGTDIGLSVFHGLLPSDTETVSFGQAG